MYDKILVGYDGSEPSDAALIEALNWARSNKGSVSMVHAVFFDSEEFSISPSQLEERIGKGKDVCLLASKRYSSEFGVDIPCEVLQGEPHDVIPDQAEKVKANLVALGTYGRKGIKRMIMGSVTSGVISHSPCDVLVVKKPCTECTGMYKSILVPFDGSQTAKRAVERASELAAKMSASLTLLYVIPRYEEMIGFIKTESIREKLYEEARRIVQEGEAIAKSKGVSANTMVEDGSPTGRILELASGLGADLIVMGHRGWSGMDKAIMGSTAERVITHCNVPVLVVR